jgi:hypothetical protein
MFERVELPSAHLFRWFLIPGCIGLAIAVVLTFLMSSGGLSSSVVLFLWPTSIVALIDPKTLWSQVITDIFTFGGNFLLYGLIGLSVGYSVCKIRSLIRAH